MPRVTEVIEAYHELLAGGEFTRAQEVLQRGIEAQSLSFLGQAVCDVLRDVQFFNKAQKGCYLEALTSHLEHPRFSKKTLLKITCELNDTEREEFLGIFDKDGNGYYIAVDPYKGAQLTVAEAVRNIAATGAKPIGLTNCLNFANPYIPENYWFFKEAVTVSPGR
jgi:hypothetical protein